VSLCRCIKLLIACALVVWGGQSIAMTKTVQRDAAGVIILCTAHGVESVVVDAQGVPLDSAPVCPECIVSIATIGAAAMQLDSFVGQIQPITFPSPTKQAKSYHSIAPAARGPPRFL